MALIRIQESNLYLVNKYGCTFVRLDVRKQIAVVLQVNGRCHLHRDKFVALATMKARHDIVNLFFCELKYLGYKVKSVLSLGQKHLIAVFESWDRKGLAPATIQSRISALRWFAESLGKAGMVRDGSYYGLGDQSLKRTYIAEVDKSWSAKGLNIDQILTEMCLLDKWVGIQARMISAFGLRLQEGVMIKPEESDFGGHLKVEQGTKGGRVREGLHK